MADGLKAALGGGRDVQDLAIAKDTVRKSMADAKALVAAMKRYQAQAKTIDQALTKVSDTLQKLRSASGLSPEQKKEAVEQLVTLKQTWRQMDEISNLDLDG